MSGQKFQYRAIPPSTPTIYLDGRIAVHAGDCLAIVKALADNSIDACVCDPPYALVSISKRFGADGAAPCKPGKTGAYQRASAGFMGKKWDTGETAFAVEFWHEVLRVLKPGAHVAAFCGTRSYHRLACAIEDAGFEVRDQLAWAYGTGFPKSHSVSKAIDRAAGAEREVVGKHSRDNLRKNGAGFRNLDGLSEDRGEIFITAPATDAAREWEGWGTALKPAWEPICLARKPLSEGTIAANVLRWGTCAINVDACRVESELPEGRTRHGGGIAGAGTSYEFPDSRGAMPSGRWPANLCHDGSPEVLAMFPDSKGQQGDLSSCGARPSKTCFGDMAAPLPHLARNDSGSAARFFYSAKAGAGDRIGSKHPTVKPVALMQWLCRLVCPPGGTVLDPFSGTGTTGAAAYREGFNAILCEREAEYLADIDRRMELLPNQIASEIVKPKAQIEPVDDEPNLPFDERIAA